MNKKQVIEYTLRETLSKYKSEDVRRVIGQINQDLQNVLEKFIDSNEGLFSDDFPIEFENEVGKWKIESSGEAWVQPKTGVQHIEVNMTILPTNQL